MNNIVSLFVKIMAWFGFGPTQTKTPSSDSDPDNGLGIDAIMAELNSEPVTPLPPMVAETKSFPLYPDTVPAGSPPVKKTNGKNGGNSRKTLGHEVFANHRGLLVASTRAHDVLKGVKAPKKMAFETRDGDILVAKVIARNGKTVKLSYRGGPVFTRALAS
jgi:hypothetical protein